MGRVVHVVDATIAMDSDRFDRLASRKRGDIVVRVGAMCNGNAQVVADIRRLAPLHSISALVIYGHGAPGIMNVAAGKSALGGRENAALSASVLADPAQADQWASLRAHFAAGGVIILKGCNTAQSEAGRRLVSALARLVGVQVLASDWYQATGVSQLVGKVISATPDGRVQESAGAGATGMLRLLRQDPVAALAVVVAELFADPR